MKLQAQGVQPALPNIQPLRTQKCRQLIRNLNVVQIGKHEVRISVQTYIGQMQHAGVIAAPLVKGIHKHF